MKLIALLRTWSAERKGDRALRIRTMGRDATRADGNHHPYEPTPYSVLERQTESGYIGEENLLVDYGCGKGRAAIFLSSRTGCKAIGVDYDADILREAGENRRRSISGANVTFYLQNAESYPVPPEADRFFFFNPFSVEILQQTMEQIKKAHEEAPKRILLFFYYPHPKYTAYLESAEDLLQIEDIDCTDLFQDEDERERILIYEISDM